MKPLKGLELKMESYESLHENVNGGFFTSSFRLGWENGEDEVAAGDSGLTSAPFSV